MELVKKAHFMDEDFLLDSETARFLYHDVASKLPIIDYHNHLPPDESLPTGGLGI